LNLGLRYDADTAVGSFGGEVTSFARFAENLIRLPGGDGYTSYENVHAARILGVEGGGRWDAPDRWLSLDGSFTAQDIRNVSSQGPYARFEGDRLPNRPWLLGAFGATVRKRALLGTTDELSVFSQSRYTRGFFRGWESLGAAGSKQTIPSQLVHSIGVTYALRTATPIAWTLEMQNVTDASVYDSYGVQRPGRALYLKVSTEL